MRIIDWNRWVRARFTDFPKYARSYLEILRADYSGLAKPLGYVAPQSVTDFMANTDELEWHWSDIVVIEDAIVDLLPDKGFGSTVQLFRERYRDIVGVDRY